VKVLVLSNLYPPDFIGGYELCCRQIVDGLLDNGHTVEVLTAPPRTPCPAVNHVSRRFELANCFDRHGMIHSTPETREMWRGRAAFVNAHNVHVLIETLQRFEPDVVYLWHLFGLGGLGLLAALQYLRMPWVWTLEDCVPRMLCCLGDYAPPALAAAYSRLVRGSYLAVSDRVVNEITAGGVELHDKLEMIPNWMLGERPPERTRFYRPGERLRIVSTGYVDRHKGVHLLIEAAARLRDRGYDNFSLDIFGKIGDASIPLMSHQLGLDRWVTFRGVWSQADLPKHYQQAGYDLFAFPTYEREPYGCSPMEAAAYGAVMAMTQSCGIGEWFVDGVHCLKIARTAEAFAELFQKVITGEVDLEPIARRTAAVVWRDFSLNKLLPRIERALQTAAKQDRQGGGNANDAYRLALLAEKLTAVMIQEQHAKAA
jgi:glycogen synthase